MEMGFQHWKKLQAIENAKTLFLTKGFLSFLAFSIVCTFFQCWNPISTKVSF